MRRFSSIRFWNGGRIHRIGHRFQLRFVFLLWALLFAVDERVAVSVIGHRGGRYVRFGQRVR